MRRALREKLVELVRGEEGVALVVTLALFFFMWLIIAGVYAIGTSVRERIHLQNAVDAAAYSAAVVQADTLSRIATINRAMAWTYAEMTRKQMDVVTCRWLREVLLHWNQDRAAARANAWGTGGCRNHGHITSWSISNPRLVVAGGARVVAPGAISVAITAFPERNVSSQIVQDRATIASMNAALSRLENANTYLNNVTNAAVAIARANLGSRANGAVFTTLIPIRTSLDDLAAPADGSVTSVLRTNLARENRFLDYIRGNTGGSTILREFGLGGVSGSGWFQQDFIGGPQRCGFRRRYAQANNGALRATWTWTSVRWTCTPHTHWATYAACPHQGHNLARCRCQPRGRVLTHRALVTADNSASFNQFYSTPLVDAAGRRTNFDAQPRILNSKYFGSAGTITVGLSVTNRNPWASFMTIGGLYRAFDHYCDNTVVFASAKAGYRNYAAGKKFGRDYRIDWRSGDPDDLDDEQYWNLYTSDWDAVMVPVRMANSSAQQGSWSYVRTPLRTWVSRLGVKSDALLSGGGVDPDTSVVDQINDDSSVESWRWYNWRLKQNTHNAGKVQAKWRIGNAGSRPNWGRLEDRMFH